MVTGLGLGWVKSVLQADSNGRSAYAAMVQSPEFKSPLRWADVRAADFDAVLLPDGHAKGMRPYLESTVLQSEIAQFLPPTNQSPPSATAFCWPRAPKRPMAAASCMAAKPRP
jgi:hypothetical protein